MKADLERRAGRARLVAALERFAASQPVWCDGVIASAEGMCNVELHSLAKRVECFEVHVGRRRRRGMAVIHVKHAPLADEAQPGGVLDVASSDAASAGYAAQYTGLGMPPLQSELAKWAQWAVVAQKWHSDALGVDVKIFRNAGEDRGAAYEDNVGVDLVAAEPDVASSQVTIELWASGFLHSPDIEMQDKRAGVPPLRSQLAKWAQWAAAVEMWQSESTTGRCLPYPLLSAATLPTNDMN